MKERGQPAGAEAPGRDRVATVGAIPGMGSDAAPLTIGQSAAYRVNHRLARHLADTARLAFREIGVAGTKRLAGPEEQRLGGVARDTENGTCGEGTAPLPVSLPHLADVVSDRLVSEAQGVGETLGDALGEGLAAGARITLTSCA